MQHHVITRTVIHPNVSRSILEIDGLADDENEDAYESREPQLLEGDIVTWRGEQCEVWRIGWRGDPSPFNGDPTLRAYVVPQRRVGWTDWAPVSTLLGLTEGDWWMEMTEAS